MKYQIGDTVLILHSNEEARIVDIINDKMLLVDVEGVQFPVYMDQVDFPYFKRFSEKKMFPVKKEKKYVDDLRKEKPSKEIKVQDGIWLSFLPVSHTDTFGDELVTEMKIHLVNRTDSGYTFVYKLHFFGKPDFELTNRINPFEDFYLHDIDFSDLNDSPSFEFVFTLSEPDIKKAGRFESLIKLKPKQVFARIKETREQNKATFSYLLFEVYPDKKPEEKFETDILHKKGSKSYDAKKARQHIEAARSVIDLHIEKLSDDWKHMSNYEILSLQLKIFEKYYELAIAHVQPSLTVIHGVGRENCAMRFMKYYGEKKKLDHL